MSSEPRKIEVAPGSDLAQLLDEASAHPLLLEKDGVLYRLDTEKEDIWAGYDPAKVQSTLSRTAGSWSDIDVDALISLLYRDREEGSRPVTRP